MKQETKSLEKELKEYFGGLTWKRFTSWNKSVKTKEHALRLMNEVMINQKTGKCLSIQL